MRDQTRFAAFMDESSREKTIISGVETDINVQIRDVMKSFKFGKQNALKPSENKESVSQASVIEVSFFHFQF